MWFVWLCGLCGMYYFMCGMYYFMYEVIHKLCKILHFTNTSSKQSSDLKSKHFYNFNFPRLVRIDNSMSTQRFSFHVFISGSDSHDTHVTPKFLFHLSPTESRRCRVLILQVELHSCQSWLLDKLPNSHCGWAFFAKKSRDLGELQCFFYTSWSTVSPSNHEISLTPSEHGRDFPDTHMLLIVVQFDTGVSREL